MSNMVINTNVLALNAHRYMRKVGEMQYKASQRLSSGLRINTAADDAAGLAISEKMRAQVRGLNQAAKNSQDAISLIQTAEGGMQEINDMLQRIRELTVQASNDTNEHNELGTGDRQKMQDEVNQLVQEIDSMAERVEFNKKKVINGEYANLQDVLDQRNKQLDAATNEQAATAMKAAQAALALDSANAAIATFAATNLDYATYEAAKTAYQASEANFLLGYNNLTADPNYSAMLAEVTAATGTAYTGNTASSLYDFVKANSASIVANAALATAYIALGDTRIADANALSAATDTWNLNTAGQKQLRDLQLSAATATQTKKSADKLADLAQTRYDMANDLQIQAANAVINAGGNSQSLYFQVGANANQGLEINIGSIKSNTLGIGDGMGNTTIDLLKNTGADTTGILDVLDTALSYVTTERSKLGAAQNRLEYTIRSLNISAENLSASESRIRDADMAKEMMDLTKSNVLQQAATSMLAQANQAPQNILQLLR